MCLRLISQKQAKGKTVHGGHKAFESNSTSFWLEMQKLCVTPAHLEVYSIHGRGQHLTGTWIKQEESFTIRGKHCVHQFTGH